MSDRCECVRCSQCDGSGNVWFEFPGPPRGRYLGRHRSDDLDEMETCEECGGSGIVETCEMCAEALQEEYERDAYQDDDNRDPGIPKPGM